MECPACGRTAADADRFCNGCGTELVRSPARPADDQATDLVVATAEDEWVDDEPLWAPTGSLPTQPIGTAGSPTATSTGQSVGRQAGAAAAGAIAAGAAQPQPTDRIPTAPPPAPPTTTTMPAAPPAARTATMPMIDPQPLSPVSIDERRRRIGPVTLLSVVGVAATLVGLFTNVVSIEVDVPVDTGGEIPFAFRTGDWFVEALGGNLMIAALIAAASMAVGGTAAAFGWRWGSGLAGGAGVAMAGLSGLMLGLAQYPIDAAAEFARIPPVPPFEPFVLTITRDIGYWALLVAGVVGLIVFFASMNDAAADGPGDLNPWLAAMGGVAVLVIVVGPLLPEGRAIFSDNWYLVEGPGEPPAMLMVMRLVQLGLLGLAGLIGFLSVRRWGLGVAVGATLPIMWLALSTLFELTERPIGPGFRNPGTTEMAVHAVTIIGVCATAAFAVLAIVAAVDRSQRR